MAPTRGNTAKTASDCSGTVREFREGLHKKRLAAIRAEVLAEKKRPPTSEKAPPGVREKKSYSSCIGRLSLSFQDPLSEKTDH